MLAMTQTTAVRRGDGSFVLFRGSIRDGFAAFCLPCKSALGVSCGQSGGWACTVKTKEPSPCLNEGYKSDLTLYCKKE